ncbi:hypothetical protein Btru_052401 [Bulinus truncatus]|nr:hypothetical protein Btru_052401 [Bulinus truncatus]
MFSRRLFYLKYVNRLFRKRLNGMSFIIACAIAAVCSEGSYVRLHTYKQQLSHTSCSFQLESDRDFAVLVGTVHVVPEGKNQVAVLTCQNRTTGYVYTVCTIKLDVRQCIVLVYYIGCYCETTNMGVMGVVMSFKVKMLYQDSFFMLSYFPNYPNLTADDTHSNILVLPEIIDPEVNTCVT